MNAIPVPPGPDVCNTSRISEFVMLGFVAIREENAVEKVVIPQIRLSKK